MNRGFSLLEVQIALGIMATVVIAVALVALGTPEVLRTAQAHEDALTHARARILKELARGPLGFSLIQASEETQETFISMLRVERLGDGASKALTSETSWAQGYASPRSVRIASIATDYANAHRYPCSPFAFGIELLEGGAPYQVAVPLPEVASLAANRTHVAALGNATSGVSDPSLFLFEAGNQQLALSASFDQATSTKTGYVAAALSSTHLYALSAHACTGAPCASLEVFPLDSVPLRRTASIPLPSARSLAYGDGRLYAGLRTSATNPELLVFDLADPGLPARIGSAEIGASVNDIALDGEYAYLATSDNSAAGNRALMSFSVREPHEGMLPSARARQPGAGISQQVAQSGDALYLGRSSPLNSKEFYVFSANDLNLPLHAYDTDSSVAGLVVQGFQAFVLTRTQVLGIDVHDPSKQEAVYTLPEDHSGVALVCSGKELYIASNGPVGGYVTRMPL